MIIISNKSYSQNTDAIPFQYKVTLKEAHIGDLQIDTKLLDSYQLLPENYRQFYFAARLVFSKNADADFTNPEIIQAAKKYDIPLMAGPMLGKLHESGVSLWFRPATKDAIEVRVINSGGSNEKIYKTSYVIPGVEQSIDLSGLTSNTDYTYAVYSKKRMIAEGSFTTAPPAEEQGIFRLAFGSCFHKVGIHNPNLVNQILKREIHAMALLGDIAVDDRENKINMHRSDYLLRDVSKPWRLLAANMPLYTSWDDHDYLNNDLSGIPEQFNNADREALRAVWNQNWNNPKNAADGIYFNTRIGPVELIMLDTRSCRTVEERGQYGSYLGLEQQKWLQEVLKNSTAPFKVISSGTMWSDFITDGKDSWGTWDTLAREEIFMLIESENISGVLLISGDRHGARGFMIPSPSGFKILEFEVASLGGVPGPDAMAKDTTNQLFGYDGTDIIAFGEFTFDTKDSKPNVTFRLIDEFGNILEEHVFIQKKKP
jgi:alkaline phosphatase D